MGHPEMQRQRRKRNCKNAVRGVAVRAMDAFVFLGDDGANVALLPSCEPLYGIPYRAGAGCEAVGGTRPAARK